MNRDDERSAPLARLMRRKVAVIILPVWDERQNWKFLGSFCVIRLLAPKLNGALVLSYQ